MCFFDKDDLHKIVSDEKLFSAFKLMEKEREIIFARVVKGIKYKHLAPVFKVSIARTHELYQRGIQKMKEQMIDGITKE
jgi:DNA-directed RNA polymerase specialized sigma24 family protein